jgi:hypothetical protein
MSTPLEIIGDSETDLCVDGVCAVPGPRPAEQQDAGRKDDSADSHPRRLVEVQRLGDPLERRVRA